MKLQKKEFILLHGSNLWYLGTGLFGPLLAVFTDRIGGSILDISYAWATFLATTGIAIIIVGRFSDGPRVKERFLVLGYFLNAFFTLLLLTVDSPTGLFFNQFGFGVALAFATPTWQALYAQYENKKRPSMTWALVGGEGLIIQGAAILIGGVLVKFFSFELLFVVMGCVQLLAAMFMTRILKDTPIKTKKPT